MSRSTSSALRTVSVVACLIFSAAMAHAQYRTSIQGVVTDPTGAVVPGAHLTLITPATGQKQVRDSDAAGVFNFNALAAAKFRLEVEKDGFQKKVIDNLELIPEQANSITVQLMIGASSTTVNVDASAAPLLDTETASVNGVVTANQVQHMPSYRAGHHQARATSSRRFRRWIASRRRWRLRPARHGNERWRFGRR